MEWQKIYFEIVRLISLSHNENNPFGAILELLHLAIPFESASLFYYHAESKQLEQLAEKGQKVDLAESFHFGEGKGLSSWVVYRKQPLLLNRVRKGDEYGSGDIHSIMLIPVLSDDDPVGVLSFGHSLEDAFNEENLQLADLTGKAVAGLLVKMKNEEKIRRLNQELQQRNRELKELQKKLIKQERLVAIGQISNTIAHALNNPMTVALWEIDIIEAKIVSRGLTDIHDDIHELKTSLQRISDEVKKLTSSLDDRVDPNSPSGLEMIKR